MATPTSSSNRSKRKGTKPITQGQNPQRGNRQKVSNAQVTNSSTRGGNAGLAKVTNSSQRLTRGNWETENPKITRGQRGGSFPTGVYPSDSPSSKPSSVQRRTRVNGKVKPGMVQRNQVGQPKVQRQGPTTSNVPPRATPQPPAKPSGNYKAPSIPKPVKPTAKPPVSGIRRVGGGLISGTILTAAGGKALETLGRAAQPSEWNRVQRELQARGYGGNKPVNKDPNGRSSTGVRVSDKTNQRDYKAAPTGSQQYNNYRNQQLAAERERLKGVGNPSKEKPKPPAELPRRQESGGSQRRPVGGGNNSAPRSQTPPAPRFTGTVDEGRQKWAEKYSSSKYAGQAIQKEAKKLIDEMKKRKETQSNASKAGWDGNKNY